MSDSAPSGSNSSSSRWESAVADQGVYHSKCGYCKSSSRSSVAHGLVAHRLTVQDYQDLLDRGWRRSGTFLYKPEMPSACCPQYTIRLKASSFVASREQGRVLKRMQRFLEEDKRPEVVDGHDDTNLSAVPYASDARKYMDTDASDSVTAFEDICESVTPKGSATAPVVCHKKDIGSMIMKDLSHSLEMGLASYLAPGCLGANSYDVVVRPVSAARRTKLQDLAGNIEYTSSIAFAVCGQTKVKQEQTNASETDQGSTVHMSPVELAELLAERIQGSSNLHGFSVQASNGHINFIGNRSSSAAGTIAENAVQKRSGSNLDVSPNRKARRGDPIELPKKHRLEISTSRSRFDAEEFELYRKYQSVVHNDKPEHLKEASYCRFLVETPLVAAPPADQGSSPPCGFGSFHQQYRIDGRLVAVGVVDILPNCLSSKYLFWDPDFSFLSLGKFTAMQEIRWVEQAQKECPSLEYYYMGYYIHSCPKMQYKAAYKPSELLCPVQLSWVPYTIAQPLIEKRPVACLSAGDVDFDWSKGSSAYQVDALDDYTIGRKSQIEAESSAFVELLSKVPILFKASVVQLKDLKARLHPKVFARLRQELRQYVDLVGHNAAARILYTL